MKICKRLLVVVLLVAGLAATAGACESAKLTRMLDVREHRTGKPVSLMLRRLARSEQEFSKQTINSISEVQAIFDSAKAGDLFVFDIDEVILEPSEPMFQPRIHRDSQYQDLFIRLDDKRQRGAQEVEPKVTENIKKLLNRGINVIVLTARNNTQDDRDRTFDQLNDIIKIQNNQSFWGDENVILAGYGNSKGEALRNFLKNINDKPKKIYFFDDTELNVNSVFNEMQTAQIPCAVFLYQYAYNKPKIYGATGEAVERRILEYQCEQFRDKGYIPYAQAKKELNKK